MGINIYFDMEKIDYIKLARDFKFVDEYWYAVTKDGHTIECGFGLIPNEFNLLTYEKIDKAILEADINWEEEYKKKEGKLIEPLKPIEGHWTLDGHHWVVTKNKTDRYILEDLYEEEHPDEDSFRLVPKSDIVETYFIKKEIPKPLHIKVS